MQFIAVKDRMSKKVWAFVVKEKGVNSFAVEKLAKMLTSAGYRRVIIKPDREPAIMALTEAVKREVELEV